MITIPLWLFVAMCAAIVLLLGVALRKGSGGDMIERQRRATRLPSADEAKALALPEVQAALQQGHKIEAIRIVREHTGLGLKESKELVESANRQPPQ